MFLLPWSSGTGSEKILPKEGKIPTAKARTSPVFPMPLLSKGKRKRDSDEQANEQLVVRPAKKGTSEELPSIPVAQVNTEEAAPVGSASEKSSSQPRHVCDSGVNACVNGGGADQHISSYNDTVNPTTSSQQPGSPQIEPKDAQGELEARQPARNPIRTQQPPSLETLRQTIESQFSLEILLKHRELRLIDQELAKCQVALEQLRRCHVMPYPAITSDPAASSMVNRGVGPSYNNEVPHAPPWGVTEGPYSRHYAKWLIPDPAFGDDVPEYLTPRHAGKGLSDRASRGNKSQKTTGGTSSRAQRGSARERLQSLPHGYPEPKESKGPMMVKRSTDGRMVKLVCLDCRREDFNSAQGFINHCRIAHGRGFASHDAAAIACGEEVEVDAQGGVVGENVSSSNASAGLVHPLIRSAHLTSTNPPVATSDSRKRNTQPSISASQSQADSYDGTKDAFSTPVPAAKLLPRSKRIQHPSNHHPMHLISLLYTRVVDLAGISTKW